MNEVQLAQKYISKANNARTRGISFELSFSAYKRLMRTKYCKYTGVELTEFNGTNSRLTDRTVERIDNSIGYTDKNCVAACSMANQIKSYTENQNNCIELKHLINLGKAMAKL